MLFHLHQLLGSFQNHKKMEFDKIKTALKNKVQNERKQLEKEFDREVRINKKLVK
jgi:sterol desaturase/sphingolipid hydroxylase (fatty acid hydroxylase superfamily)